MNIFKSCCVVAGVLLLLGLCLAAEASAARYDFSYSGKSRLGAVAEYNGSTATGLRQDLSHDAAGNVTVLAKTGGIADSDGDGMPDDWETQYGLNPALNDAGLDTDGDGLTNLQEYQYGTDPTKQDTDNDGLSDAVEVNDNNIWTSPLAKDTDQDGMADGWEDTYGFDLSIDDGQGDADGDGYTNVQEYTGHSDPNDPASLPSWRVIPYLLLIFDEEAE
jgi:hypothetical protein